VTNLTRHRYQGKVDIFDVENITLNEYLAESDHLLTSQDLEFYINLWNEVIAVIEMREDLLTIN